MLLARGYPCCFFPAARSGRQLDLPSRTGPPWRGVPSGYSARALCAGAGSGLGTFSRALCLDLALAARHGPSGCARYSWKLTIAELCLHGFQKIPFTCSYLPGKSNFHITFWLCLLGILNLTYRAAKFEQSTLEHPGRPYAAMVMILAAAAACARWRTAARAKGTDATLLFEESPRAAISALELHRDGVLPV